MYGSCDAVAWRQVARTLHQQTVTLVRKMGVLTSQGYPSPSHTLTYTGHARHAGREGTLHTQQLLIVTVTVLVLVHSLVYWYK